MFKRFYNTAVDVYDDLGDTKYASERKCVYIGSIMADIQPFRIGTIDSLKKREFGFAPDSTKKLFCEKNGILKQGALLDINGKHYRVAYAVARNLGMLAVIREVVA